METKFHISLPCLNVETTRDFYCNTIGASAGRQAENWVDINLFGHQITFTKAEKFEFNTPSYMFEGQILPSFHFGVIIPLENWEAVYAALRNKELEPVAQATFLQDKKGEHTSFFIKDPNGYILEFKTFKDPGSVFENEERK